MKVQESRYRSHGDYAYVNADNEEQLPRFIDDAVISRFPALIDKSRAEIKEAALQLSTKSVFGWYALFRTPWVTRCAGVPPCCSSRGAAGTKASSPPMGNRAG